MDMRCLYRLMVAMTKLLKLSKGFEKPDNRKCSDLCAQVQACITSTFDPSRRSCSLESGASQRSISSVVQMTQNLRTTSRGKSFHFIFFKRRQPTTFGRFLLAVPHMSADSDPVHQAYQLSFSSLKKTPYKQLDSRRIAAMVFIPPLNILVLSKKTYAIKQMISYDWQTKASVELSKVAPYAFGVDNERLIIFFSIHMRDKQHSRLYKLFLESKKLVDMRTYYRVFRQAISVDSKAKLLYCSYDKVIVVLTYNGDLLRQIKIQYQTNALSLDNSRSILYFTSKNNLTSLNLKQTTNQTIIAELLSEPRGLVVYQNIVYVYYRDNSAVSAVKLGIKARKSKKYKKDVTLKRLGSKGLQICLIK